MVMKRIGELEGERVVTSTLDVARNPMGSGKLRVFEAHPSLACQTKP